MSGIDVDLLRPRQMVPTRPPARDEAIRCLADSQDALPRYSPQTKRAAIAATHASDRLEWRLMPAAAFSFCSVVMMVTVMVMVLHHRLLVLSVR